MLIVFIYFAYSNAGTLPSFLRKRQSRHDSSQSTVKRSIKTWDKDIVCLPKSYGVQPIIIPRGKNRTLLGECGLIGKVHLISTMTEEEVKSEIFSVFANQMKENEQFPFTFLQCNGGGSKTLIAPTVSKHFQWTAQQVVSLAGQGAIYILANDDLNIPVSIKTCNEF